jgi:hypothetical protein
MRIAPIGRGRLLGGSESNTSSVASTCYGRIAAVKEMVIFGYVLIRP